MNARHRAELQNGIHSRVHANADCCAIFRFRQRLPGGYRTFVAVLGAFRAPFTKNSSRAPNHHCAIIERRIFHKRAWEHSFLKSRRINERQHSCADGPFCLERPVILVVLEIAPTNQNQDIAGLIINPDHGALEIFRRGLSRRRPVRFRFAKGGGVFGISLMIVIGMLLYPLEVRAERILSHFLKINIDSGVNAKTLILRPVPSDGGDDLLANIIDRVALALRILPAADDDLFGSCAGTSFTADEVKIAHAV